jgi:LemA protein
MTVVAVLLSALVLAVALGVVWMLTLYNGLIAARQECERAWFNIDVLLKQRHDEVPRLVEICRGHMAYEKDTLERVVVARMTFSAARDLPAQTRASQSVSDSLRQLFAVAEGYPELKADESFAKLSARITELENQIADRRELYNAATTSWNTRIEQLPDAFLARAAGMKRRELWRAAPAERLAVRANLAASR